MKILSKMKCNFYHVGNWMMRLKRVAMNTNVPCSWEYDKLDENRVDVVRVVVHSDQTHLIQHHLDDLLNLMVEGAKLPQQQQLLQPHDAMQKTVIQTNL